MQKSIFTVLVLISSYAMADLPTPNTYNNRQAYGQGLGAGADYYNSLMMHEQAITQQQQRQAQMSQATSGGQYGGDLLWMFTGSDGSLSSQMRNGFRGGEGTFWNRLWSVVKLSAYRKVLAPVDQRVTGILNGYGTAIDGLGQGQLPAQFQQGGNAPCYDCIQQRNTNPYARNQNAVNPAIFNGPMRSTGGGAAGGIR